MDFRLLYPSLYLAAVDLANKDVNLTMRRVVVEELATEKGPEKKPILYFLETAAKAAKTGAKEKRLVLNKTNASVIASMHGNEIDNWTGKRITLYPTQAQSFGKTVDCIRVRTTAPAADAPSATNPDPAIATGAA